MTSSYDPVSIVILAKEVTQAKSRLRLEPRLAQGLALSLAQRTIQTALDAASTDLVAVVTSDAVIARSAFRSGAEVFAEGRPMGMNRAAAMGRDKALMVRPTAPVAILVADLPVLRPGDLDRAIDEFRHQQQAPMYVGDHRGEGTTFLIQAPDASLGIAFGRNSALMHSRLGYAPAHRSLRGLRLDLDTPSDVRAMGGRALAKFGLETPPSTHALISIASTTSPS